MQNPDSKQSTESSSSTLISDLHGRCVKGLHAANHGSGSDLIVRTFNNLINFYPLPSMIGHNNQPLLIFATDISVDEDESTRL
jgi:hypothetical protein